MGRSKKATMNKKVKQMWRDNHAKKHSFGVSHFPCYILSVFFLEKVRKQMNIGIFKKEPTKLLLALHI